MKKFVFPTFLIFVLTSLSSLPAMAADSSADPYVGKNLSILRCMAKDDGGWSDFSSYGAFLNAVIWNDSFGEGIIEPWKDALFRNQCHASQLQKLVQGQDQVRKAIRDAFLTCNTQKLDKLTDKYNKSVVTIYYVRHIVDSGMIIGLPVPKLKLRPFNEAVTANRDELYAEMHKRFVKDKMYTQSEFDVLFTELEVAYGPGTTGGAVDPDRKYLKDSFIVCENTSWAQVGERWDEAMTNFQENWEKAGDTVSNSAKEVANEFGKSEDVEMLAGNASAADYFSSFVKLNGGDIRDEGAELGKAFSDVGEEFAASYDSVGVGEYVAGIEYAQRANDLESVRTDMANEFANLYFVSGDESLKLFLDYLDGRQTDKDKSDGLIEILEQSLPQLRKMEDGCDVINSRQCSG